MLCRYSTILDLWKGSTLANMRAFLQGGAFPQVQDCRVPAEHGRDHRYDWRRCQRRPCPEEGRDRYCHGQWNRCRQVCL